MSALRDFENRNVVSGKARPKIKKPKQYQVIFQDTVGAAVGCSVAIIRDTFNMSVAEAQKHALEAEHTGQSILYVGPQDVAETKTEIAESNRMTHLPHNSYMNYIGFKCQPIS